VTAKRKDKPADAVTFRAAFPAIQGAIRVTGNGDGMRIQLDIPETELPNAVRLIAWRENVLVVTVTADDDETGA
jgi:hypothetical protein